MKPIGLFILALSLTAWSAVPAIDRAEPVVAPAVEDANTRFEAVPVYVDPQGQPLAAYQFELSATNAKLTVVGIENGEHPAFADAPYYDPSVIASGGDRVVVAAFSLLPQEDLPRQRTRVATVMVQVTLPADAPADAAVDYRLKLVTAGNPAGEPLPAATLDRGETP